MTSLLDPPGSGLVLDVGAGPGNFTALLAHREYRVLAIDIDETDYAAAGHSPASFKAADLDEGLPDLGEQVEGAVAIEVLEHLENPMRLVRSVASQLRQGGWFIITTPNVASLSAVLEQTLRGHLFQFDDCAYYDNGHISPVGLTQVRRLAERCGLKVEVVTYNVGRIPLPRLRRSLALRGLWARNALLGEALIVKLRKTGPSIEFQRG